MVGLVTGGRSHDRHKRRIGGLVIGGPDPIRPGRTRLAALARVTDEAGPRCREIRC